MSLKHNNIKLTLSAYSIYETYSTVILIGLQINSN